MKLSYLWRGLPGHPIHAPLTDATIGAYVVGFAFLTLGGWLGGAVVFAHGMRVLKLVDEPPTGGLPPRRLIRKRSGRGLTR